MRKRHVHHLAMPAETFEAVWNGTMAYEVRKIDRELRAGDMMYLYECEGSCSYSGRFVEALVRHVTPPGTQGLSPDFGAFGFERKSIGTVSPSHALMLCSGFSWDPTPTGQSRWVHTRTGVAAIRELCMSDTQWLQHKTDKAAEANHANPTRAFA